MTILQKRKNTRSSLLIYTHIHSLLHISKYMAYVYIVGESFIKIAMKAALAKAIAMMIKNIHL